MSQNQLSPFSSKNFCNTYVALTIVRKICQNLYLINRSSLCSFSLVCANILYLMDIDVVILNAIMSYSKKDYSKYFRMKIIFVLWKLDHMLLIIANVMFQIKVVVVVLNFCLVVLQWQWIGRSNHVNVYLFTICWWNKISTPVFLWSCNLLMI